MTEPIYSIFSNTPKRPVSRVLRGAIVAGSILLATAFTALFFDIFQTAPFMLFFPAVIISTWYGGFRAGVAASVLSGLTVNYFFQLPQLGFTLNAISLLQVSVFISVTVLVSWFYETRRRLGETLERQQEWLRVTLTSIGDAVIATDINGCITFINRVAVALTEWQAQDAMGRDINEVFRIVNETTHQPVEIPIMQSLRQEVIVGLANHTLLITRTGKEIPIGDSGAPIRDAGGNVIGAILVFRDMSESRRAELSLQASEARYRDLVESANDIIYTLDLQGNFTSINKAGELTTGYLREEILETNSARIIVPDDLPLMGEALSEKLDGKPQTTYEMQIMAKDGRRLVLEVNSRLLIEDGKPAGVYGIARDITERKRAEERLTRLQSFTSRLSGASTLEQVSGVIVDEALQVMNSHSGAVGVLSADEETLEIINAYNIDLEVLQPFRKLPLNGNFALSEAVRTRQPVWIEDAETFAARYPTSYQVTASAAVCALPLIVEGEVIGGLSITFKEDRTFDQRDRDYLYAIAQQSAQAVSRAQLSRKAEETAAYEERQRLARELHDAVSQTLFSATTIAQVLPALWERNPERAFEQLEQMVVLNRAAMAEMRTLLFELRPEAIVRTSLSSLLEQLVEALHGRRQVQLDFVIEGEEITLPPDVHIAVYRVAQESLNNAVKHSSASAIAIRLQRTSERVVLTVRDNGKGFDMSRTTPGFGLGTMQERAEAIDAVLQIRSQLDQGTEVKLEWMRPQV